MLRNLSSMSVFLGVLLGDFGELLSTEDKCGRVKHPSWLFNVFRDTISACNLIDIELVGYPFKWWRGRGTDRAVEGRLDRAIAIADWLSLFLEACLRNLMASITDHNLILLYLVDAAWPSHKWKFKFENFWLAWTYRRGQILLGLGRYYAHRK